MHYFGRRLAQALLVLWAAFTVSFLLLQVLPGDAILIKFQNPDLGLSPAQIESMRQAYGASTPLWKQYIHSLSAILHGDFGFSVQAGVPVGKLLEENLPATLRLALPGFALAVTLAALIAFGSDLVGLRTLRNAVQTLPGLFVSIPTFWLGIALIQVFSFRLGWIPVIDPGRWLGLVLPVMTLAVPISAPLAQVLIRSLDQVALQPYVGVARSKGASHARVLFHHIARNAALPALTIAGLLFGEVLAGALVTETVFGLSGLGALTQQAVNNQDVAVLQAIVVLSAATFVVINLAVDLFSLVLDPRLKSNKRFAL